MFDAIIVGGRCAGASLAMLLGRRGLNVLMLDAAEFPSDKITSTHFIWQTGTACLKRWGLLDKLEATICPSHDSYLLDLGGLELRGGVRTNKDKMTVSCAPRRHVIDTLLIEQRLHRRDISSRLQLKLHESCRRYNLPQYKLHDALNDAISCAELFVAQAAHHRHPEAVKIGQLLHYMP